ncbi:MAG: hypothetical protein NTX52_12440 [Planctomycetota bacterium]|nr:hypothetical protein [Planctomycetota bacterium]
MMVVKTDLWRPATALPQAGLLWLYLLTLFCLIVLTGPVMPNSALAAERFEGRYFSGEGDVEYLQLLDTARRMFDPDPEFQNIAMLYNPAWNGFVEGPKWGAWWVQNSYGPTYCVLPFLTEPYVTFLQNAQDLWFDQMGDGKTSRSFGSFNWTAPDGALMDCASDNSVIYKQGDGRPEIHDWGMEFTAAGALMQSELLLISRDGKLIQRYIPKLERCANFIETRRDPNNNLFLAGPAGNLLAPSYAGWKKPNGTYDKAYLTGLSITYIAFLDRLIELEKLADYQQKVNLYTGRRDSARKGLSLLTTDEDYFIKYLDPDGTKHGVYGAEKHGYFEAVCNHDAICFRVADDMQAHRIYNKITSIPLLRRNDFIITNYPSLDDMYDSSGIFGFGTWVNGGHWSTCEARMIMGYYRLGAYEDARRSMKKLLTFAQRFQMDNPLKDFGNTPWFDTAPINLCYDNFGPPAAMIRGLFEYLYRSDRLTLLPHIPPGITKLQQKFPIRFGSKKLYLSTVGAGPVTTVKLNGIDWKFFDNTSIHLPYEQTPVIAHIQVALGGAHLAAVEPIAIAESIASLLPADDEFWEGTIPAKLRALAEKLYKFHSELLHANLGETYEAAHAKLAVDYIGTIKTRQQLLSEGKLKPLPEATQVAADQSYIDTAQKLCTGLEKVLQSYSQSEKAEKKQIYKIWFEIIAGGRKEFEDGKGTRGD